MPIAVGAGAVAAVMGGLLGRGSGGGGLPPGVVAGYSSPRVSPGSHLRRHRAATALHAPAPHARWALTDPRLGAARRRGAPAAAPRPPRRARGGRRARGEPRPAPRPPLAG